MGRRLRHKLPSHKGPPPWILRWNKRQKNIANEKERLIKQIYEYDPSIDYAFLKAQKNGELSNILYKLKKEQKRRNINGNII